MGYEEYYDIQESAPSEPDPHQIRIEYSYKSVPTIKTFSLDDTRWRAIVGPFGSGKSSGCVMELIQRAKAQAPGPDGVRRSRWAVVRNTYPQLRDTTIKTFHDWIPPHYFGTWKEAAHDFIIDQIAADDGSPVHCEVMFRALDRPDHVRNLLSLELTGCWFNEIREIAKMIFDLMDGRIGRYPAMKDGGASWAGIICDTNPPDVDHWFYKLFETERPKERDGRPRTMVYHQPSGLSPDAENLPNLREGYYEDLCIGKSQDFIRVYVHGEYGFVSDGKPVYQTWLPTIHVSPIIIKPITGYPIICGWDFGIDSGFAAVFTQLLSRPPRLNVLYELVAQDMGLRRFIEYVVKPHILTEYPGQIIYHTGDPTGSKRSDVDERTCFQEIQSHFNQRPIPAKSNTWIARFNAVDSWLTKWAGADGEGKPLPAFQVSPTCPIIIKGFNGGYRMKRLLVAGKDYYEDKPEKTLESHPHDGLQYAAMLTEEGINHRRVYGNHPSTPREPPPMGAWY